jgi:hypothetical protein
MLRSGKGEMHPTLLKQDVFFSIGGININFLTYLINIPELPIFKKHMCCS